MSIFVYQCSFVSWIFYDFLSCNIPFPYGNSLFTSIPGTRKLLLIPQLFRSLNLFLRQKKFQMIGFLIMMQSLVFFIFSLSYSSSWIVFWHCTPYEQSGNIFFKNFATNSIDDHRSLLKKNISIWRTHRQFECDLKYVCTLLEDLKMDDDFDESSDSTISSVCPFLSKIVFISFQVQCLQWLAKTKKRTNPTKNLSLVN